jgi:hypothetical protein
MKPLRSKILPLEHQWEKVEKTFFWPALRLQSSWGDRQKKSHPKAAFEIVFQID